MMTWLMNEAPGDLSVPTLRMREMVFVFTSDQCEERNEK